MMPVRESTPGSQQSQAAARRSQPPLLRHLSVVLARPPAHLLYKALDAILTAPLHPGQPLVARLRSLFHPATSNYRRIVAALSLVPGSGRRVSLWLSRPEQLPFACQKLELLAYGTGGTVFLLGDEHVLKIYRRSLGQPPETLLAIAREFRHKHEMIATWYEGDASRLPASGKEDFSLVPPAAFLILHGPVLSKAAVGMLQPYIGGRTIDFFETLMRGRLAGLLRDDPLLREQCRIFAEGTLRAFGQEGCCVDFLGRNNIVLVEADGRHRLLVIDNGIFVLDEIRLREPAKYANIERRIEQLRSLLNKIN